MKDSKLKLITLSALFAALCCVATMIIRIPTIGTNGYVNIGDAIVLLSVWIIGGPYGALAAGIGSGLADLLAGYAAYVPGTFLIKFTMAFAAYFVYNVLSKFNKFKIISYIISGLVAELIMILGYLLYEATILGYGITAFSSVGSNFIQGATCLVLGTVAMAILSQANIENLRR